MNRSKVISVVLTYILLLSGCSNTIESPTTPSAADQEALSAAYDHRIFDTDASAEQPELTNYQTFLSHPLIDLIPPLHSDVSDYLNGDSKAYRESHPPLQLWQRGFYQDDIPGYAVGPYFGFLRVLRIYDWCDEPIIDNIKVGDPRERLTELLGKPHFESDFELFDQVWSGIWNDSIEPFTLTGYRFPDFYLIVKGDEQIEELAFVADTALPGEDANKLWDIYQEAGYRGLEACDAEPFYSYNPWEVIVFINGIVLDGHSMRVYGNYEGDIYGPCDNYDDLDDTLKVDFIFMLQMSYQMRRGSRSQLGTAAPPATLTLSPDKSNALLHSLSERPVEGTSYIVRYLDNSQPDLFIGASAQSLYLWLDNQYLLVYNSMYPDLYCVTDVHTRQTVDTPDAYLTELLKSSGCVIMQ